jgi:hypothetical protein
MMPIYKELVKLNQNLERLIAIAEKSSTSQKEDRLTLLDVCQAFKAVKYSPELPK